MDGPWQLGYRTADEYGRIASQTAKAMRQVNENLELVACGSSSAHMPTFGEWERVVLNHTYDDVDYISCHAYYQEKNGDLDSFLASAVDMDHFIETVVATADHVGAVRNSKKKINISFDEWNVWYLDRYQNVDRIVDPHFWPEAPRLLEDKYSVVDAVVFGSLLISLLNHSDRVTSASLAQLVNVIAPIMTEPGDISWKQTTFFPFAISSRLAQGESLKLRIEAPTFKTEQYGEVSLVDAAASHDEATGATSLFLVNRSKTETISLEVSLGSLKANKLVSAQSLHDKDIHAANTLENPTRVAMQANDSAKIKDGYLLIELPPISWSAVELS
jgi:alpha-N-arabinofuranosidase